jgi:hypothetical protein
VGLGLTTFTRGHFAAPCSASASGRIQSPADVTNDQRQQAEESKAWVTQIVLTRLTSLTQRQKKKHPKYGTRVFSRHVNSDDFGPPTKIP